MLGSKASISNVTGRTLSVISEKYEFKSLTVYRICPNNISNLLNDALVPDILNLICVGDGEANVPVIFIVLPALDRTSDSDMLSVGKLVRKLCMAEGVARYSSDWS